MPSLRASAVNLDAERWQPLEPVMGGPLGHAPSYPPALPQHLLQSAVMLGSLPVITTNVSVAAANQFYGGRTLPRRQVSLP